MPGPAGGEGCSLEGGCASCPYMKMNTLAALQGVCEKAGSPVGEAMLEVRCILCRVLVRLGCLGLCVSVHI